MQRLRVTHALEIRLVRSRGGRAFILHLVALLGDARVHLGTRLRCLARANVISRDNASPTNAFPRPQADRPETKP